MRVRIVAVGRLRDGPEKRLVDDYLDRFSKTGRAHGLGPAEVIEVEDKRGGGKSAEGALLGRAIPENACLCALDERGAVMSSPDFSDQLASWRRQDHRDLVFAIGGADGLSPELIQRADAKLSFGKMVWPHMLVRVMLAEQLYRAATILAGGPYHRA